MWTKMASPKPWLPILLTLTGEQKGETPLPLADSGDAVGQIELANPETVLMKGKNWETIIVNPQAHCYQEANFKVNHEL